MASPIFLTESPTSYTDNILFGAVILVAAIWFIRATSRPKFILHYGWGQVYVFRDVDNPRLFKVGMTRRSSKIRMAEVSETMTGGASLEQVYAVKVPYVTNIEALAHLNLKAQRHWSDRGTEWFKTDERTAIRAVNRAAWKVRGIARRQRKWSAEADKTATSWLRTKNGPVTRRLF